MSVNFGSPFQPSFGGHPTTILSGPGNTVQYTGLPGGFQLSSINTPVPQQSQFQTGFGGSVLPQPQTGFAGGVAPQQQPQFQTGFGGGFFQQPAVQQLAYPQGFQQPAPQFQNGPLYQQPYQPQPVNSGLQDILGMVMNLMGSMLGLMMNQLNGQQGQNQPGQNGYGQNNYGQDYGNTGYNQPPAGNGYDNGYQTAGYNNAYPAEEITQDTTIIVEKEMDKHGHKHGHKHDRHDNGRHRGHHKHEMHPMPRRMDFDA